MIKLRIWDRIKNCYLSPFSYGWRFADVISGEYDEVIKIELWTGCYDKNGKMIYDGDILEEVEGDGDVVYFRDGCFWIDDVWLYDYTDSCEVIGNINENPELLK